MYCVNSIHHRCYHLIRDIVKALSPNKKNKKFIMKKYSRYHNVPSIDFNMIMINVCYSGLHMKMLVQKMGLKVDDSTEVFSLESFNKYLACVFTVTKWGRSRQNLHIVE